MPEPRFDFTKIAREGERRGDVIDSEILRILSDEFALDLHFMEGLTEADKILTNEFIKIFAPSHTEENPPIMGSVVAFLIKAQQYRQMVAFDTNHIKPPFSEVDGYIEQNFDDDSIIPELEARIQEIFKTDEFNVILDETLQGVLRETVSEHARKDDGSTLFSRFMDNLKVDAPLNQLLVSGKI